jgi:hypothetical protein
MWETKHEVTIGLIGMNDETLLFPHCMNKIQCKSGSVRVSNRAQDAGVRDGVFLFKSKIDLGARVSDPMMLIELIQVTSTVKFQGSAHSSV